MTLELIQNLEKKQIKDLDTYLHFKNPQLGETLHASLRHPPGLIGLIKI